MRSLVSVVILVMGLVAAGCGDCSGNAGQQPAVPDAGVSQAAPVNGEGETVETAEEAALHLPEATVTPATAEPAVAQPATASPTAE